jgi:hypothetical protein
MANQVINMGVVSEKTKSFFEVHTTKDGTQYMAVRGDIEVSGFTTSKTRAVVERIVERIVNAGIEPPPNVSMVADRLADYVVSMITQFGSDYVSIATTVKAGEAKLTLSVYLTLYADEKVYEWRGHVEVLVDGRDGKKSEGRHLVKRRVVFTDNVSGFSLYRELMRVARHAYNAIVVGE